MQFNSYLFLFVFLPLTLAGYFGLYRLGRDRGARLFLAGASFVFFGYGNPWYVALLLVSALFNWRVSRLLLGKAGSRLLLACGILANVGLLFYYKYFNFFIDNLNLLLKEDWVFDQEIGRAHV